MLHFSVRATASAHVWHGAHMKLVEMFDTPPQILGEYHEGKICTCTIRASIVTILSWVPMVTVNEPFFTKATPAILTPSINHDVTEHLVLMLFLATPTMRKIIVHIQLIRMQNHHVHEQEFSQGLFCEEWNFSNPVSTASLSSGQLLHQDVHVFPIDPNSGNLRKFLLIWFWRRWTR